MNKTSKLHMTTDEFRKQGHKVIDWLADYYEKIEDYPVMSQLSPNEIINNLPLSPSVFLMLTIIPASLLLVSFLTFSLGRLKKKRKLRSEYEKKKKSLNSKELLILSI